MDQISASAREAIATMRRQLDQGAIAALRAGMDWVEGPMQDPNPLRWMRDFDIFEKQSLELVVKAGPLPAGAFRPAPGWRVIRHADWVAAGQPGDIPSFEAIQNPRCPCPQETVRRVVLDNGTCHMAGCPYGGDV